MIPPPMTTTRAREGMLGGFIVRQHMRNRQGDFKRFASRILVSTVPLFPKTSQRHQLHPVVVAAFRSDTQPDNVMLVPDPDVPGGERVKILDFGIATRTFGVFVAVCSCEGSVGSERESPLCAA